MPYKDPAKMRKVKFDWYEKHKDTYFSEYYEKNKERIKARVKAHRKLSAVALKRYMLKKKFGLSLERYNEIADSQNRVCAICARDNGKFALAVDHCHRTGKIRGLLCSGCNMALGAVENVPGWMEAASSYLAKYNGHAGHDIHFPTISGRTG